jgi:hypothetical protein
VFRRDSNVIGFLSQGGHLENTYSLQCLALKSFQSMPRRAEQLILFSGIKDGGT